MANDASHWHLSEEERAKVGVQVEHFISVLAARYEITPQEVVEAVKWVRQHRTYLESLRKASVISVIGVLISALLLAAWEGMRGLFPKG